MRTLIVFRSGGKGLARKASPAYAPNRCGCCGVRLHDPFAWLCAVCRGEEITLPEEVLRRSAWGIGSKP